MLNLDIICSEPAYPSLAEDGSTVAIVALAQAANEDATTKVVLDDGV